MCARITGLTNMSQSKVVSTGENAMEKEWNERLGTKLMEKKKCIGK